MASPPGQDAGALERTARTVGLRRRLVAAPGQTALDLCADAATRLLAACPEPGRAQVDAVIFVTQTPDYAQPNNACLLHGRLGLARPWRPTMSRWVVFRLGLRAAAGGLLCARRGAPSCFAPATLSGRPTRAIARRTRSSATPERDLGRARPGRRRPGIRARPRTVPAPASSRCRAGAPVAARRQALGRARGRGR
jgi:hypothetical protein